MDCKLPGISLGSYFLLLTSLTALFSFHELFIYYLLQPFTGDMRVVNPVYKFVSGVLYWISYINLRLHVSGFAYSIVVSMVLLLYVFVGYVLIIRFAPKTFKIKRIGENQDCIIKPIHKCEHMFYNERKS